MPPKRSLNPKKSTPQFSLPQVFLSTTDTSASFRAAAKRGEIQKIGPRLYTTDTHSPPEEVVRRNLWVILDLLFPDAVIAHRTALETKPTPDGTVFLSAPYTRTVTLPGHSIRLVKGPGHLEGDTPFMQHLWIASKPRAFLENLRPARARGGVSRAVPRAEVERLLERTLSIAGPDEFNRIRDAARSLAPLLHVDAEFEILDDIIGTLIGTRSSKLSAPTALARIAGRPYDAHRLPLFDALVAELRQASVPPRREPSLDADGKRNLAFVDAYFSNYIEGTEFEVDEAIEIVFENKIPSRRPEDAHDILGTYRLLADDGEMRQSVTHWANDLDGFLDVLQRRHALLMEGRPNVRPGEFKTEGNRAGATMFVAPALVIGTLEKGLAYVRALDTPFARAAFMMFLVTEVHPFTDGNGRLARIMMNAELAAANECRIIIPTVYRDSYIQALRNLSRQHHAETLVDMLDVAQRFTGLIDWRRLPDTLAQLHACNAFRKAADDRLLLPDSSVVQERLRRGLR